MAVLLVGAGLVGSQIARILVEKGERPVLMDRAPQPKALSCKTDVSVRPASAYAVPTESGDVYVCYGFDPKTTSKRHIIGMAPRI